MVRHLEGWDISGCVFLGNGAQRKLQIQQVQDWGLCLVPGESLVESFSKSHRNSHWEGDWQLFNEHADVWTWKQQQDLLQGQSSDSRNTNGRTLLSPSLVLYSQFPQKEGKQAQKTRKKPEKEESKGNLYPGILGRVWKWWIVFPYAVEITQSLMGNTWQCESSIIFIDRRRG